MALSHREEFDRIASAASALPPAQQLLSYLIFDVGLRLSEALRLDHGDLVSDPARVRVPGKTHEQIVTLNEHAAALIAAIPMRGSDIPLFQAPGTNRVLSLPEAKQLLHALADAAGVGVRSLHEVRQSCIREALLDRK